MAGNYPDVPSWRMAWDLDGTQLLSSTGGYGDVNNVSSSLVANLNDDQPSSGSGGVSDRWYFWIFPEHRDLDGYFLQTIWDDYYIGTQSGPFQVSTNTTNGVDGTWVTLKNASYDDGNGAFSIASTSVPPLRTHIEANTVLGVKGLRMYMSGGSREMGIFSSHFYGEPAPGENLQRLEIWHPTLDQRVDPAYFDWGDVPRNSSETREFRVKNLHPTLTANSVRVAMSALTDTTPSVVGQMGISQDGGVTWGAQQTLPSPLGPEAISPVLQIRRQTPSNAVLSLWWYRLFAEALSWT